MITVYKFYCNRSGDSSLSSQPEIQEIQSVKENQTAPFSKSMVLSGDLQKECVGIDYSTTQTLSMPMITVPEDSEEPQSKVSYIIGYNYNQV